MSKEERFYYKIGQAVCEGLGCMIIGGTFLAMFLLYIF